MEKISKEGWLEWLQDKAGPEMIFAVILGLANDPEKMAESIFEYVIEVQEG